tara:strand:+ start:1551 stop:2429 length:879 start_codon:yes stop_codon:yes gene_type:complete
MADYTVKRGDTLWAIWRDNLKDQGVSWAQFKRLNPNLDFAYHSIIHVGDTVNLGDTVAESPAPEPTPVDETSPVETSPVDTTPAPTPVDESPAPAPAPAPAPTPYEPLPSLEAREELLVDPAYAAFMASFGMDLATAKATLESTYDRFLAGATRSFGQWAGPTYRQDDPATQDIDETIYGVDDEGVVRQATNEELLDPTLRSGGLYDVGYGRLMDESADEYAGKGMAFSGGAKKANVRIMEERDLGKADYFRTALEGYQDAQLVERRERERLIRAKLAKEAEAAERLSLEIV